MEYEFLKFDLGNDYTGHTLRSIVFLPLTEVPVWYRQMFRWFGIYSVI